MSNHLAPSQHQANSVSVWSPPAVNGSAKRRSPLTLIVVITAIAGILVGIGGTLGAQYAVTALGKDDRLREAVSLCSAYEGVNVEDGGETIVIDVRGAEDLSGASYEDEACILRKLDAPANVTSHIEQTTSMDGRQTETWDDIKIEWSFHPDRGADMIITLNK